MAKPEDKFRTKIPEPRWQQVVSVVVVLLLLGAEIFIVFHHR
jgi:hypothetical protein